MPYRVNEIIDREEFVRHHAPERHYIAGLREKGLLIEIGNVIVDGEQLVLRTFQCNTNYCVRCSGEKSATTYKGSCCTDLQVDVTDCEKGKLTDLARMAREKLDLKPRDPLRAIVDRVLDGEILEINESHEQVLIHKKSGACVMSWIDETGQFRCSINSLCHRLGLPVSEYKPGPCFLFPLHYSEYDRNRYIVSLLTEETRFWITHHPTVSRLRCLRVPEPGSPPAYEFLRGEIEFLFGGKFYPELDRLARPILEKYLNGAGAKTAKTAA